MIGLARLRDFVIEVTALVEATRDEPRLITEGRELLSELVAHDDWLPSPYAEPDASRYCQYLLHCDPPERFSLVSLFFSSEKNKYLLFLKKKKQKDLTLLDALHEDPGLGRKVTLGPSGAHSLGSDLCARHQIRAELPICAHVGDARNLLISRYSWAVLSPRSSPAASTAAFVFGAAAARTRIIVSRRTASAQASSGTSIGFAGKGPKGQSS